MKNTDEARFSLASLDDTEEFGKSIADALVPGLTLLMNGTLGAGKTTLVSAICRALGWRRTCSPTFALVNEYAKARIPIAHADLYRIENADGRDFGFDDYLDDGWVLIIEWPDRLNRRDFPENWDVDIKADGTSREITITAHGAAAAAALAELRKTAHDERLK